MEDIIAYSNVSGSEQRYFYEGLCGRYQMTELDISQNIITAPFFFKKETTTYCLNILFKFWRYPDNHPLKIKELNTPASSRWPGDESMCIECLCSAAELLYSRDYKLEKIGEGDVGDV